MYFVVLTRYLLNVLSHNNSSITLKPPNYANIGKINDVVKWMRIIPLLKVLNVEEFVSKFIFLSEFIGSAFKTWRFKDRYRRSLWLPKLWYQPFCHELPLLFWRKSYHCSHYCHLLLHPCCNFYGIFYSHLQVSLIKRNYNWIALLAQTCKKL